MGLKINFRKNYRCGCKFELRHDLHEKAVKPQKPHQKRNKGKGLALASFSFPIASRQFVCLDLPKGETATYHQNNWLEKSVAANDVLELVLK